MAREQATYGTASERSAAISNANGRGLYMVHDDVVDDATSMLTFESEIDRRAGLTQVGRDAEDAAAVAAGQIRTLHAKLGDGTITDGELREMLRIERGL